MFSCVDCEITKCFMCDFRICEYMEVVKNFFNILVIEETHIDFLQDFSLFCNFDSSKCPNCMSLAPDISTCIWVVDVH